MRVIAGSKKGQPLRAVPGERTRPTSDKVKEALFNLIGYPKYSNGLALDLYAGTGALGIEALSRGLVEKCIFVDNQHKAVEIIRENLKKTSFLDRSEVYKNDALRALKALIKRKLRFHLIFLDPPYEGENLLPALTRLESNQLLVSDGMIVVETKKQVSLPEQLGSLALWKQKIYGQTEIRIYRKGSDAKDESGMSG